MASMARDAARNGVRDTVSNASTRDESANVVAGVLDQKVQSEGPIHKLVLTIIFIFP